MIRLCLAFALLSVPAQAQDGAALFAAYCSACHGEDAGGGNSPDIRGSTIADVTRAVRGFEEMPEIELTEAEKAAIGTWLMSLTD